MKCAFSALLRTVSSLEDAYHGGVFRVEKGVFIKGVSALKIVDRITQSRMSGNINSKMFPRNPKWNSI